MAGWACYRTVLRAEAPLHLGWHRLGLIERTRYYLPGRSLWGALVAGLAGRLYGGSDRAYTEATRLVKDSVRLTYWFAASREDATDGELWRPDYAGSGSGAGVSYGRQEWAGRVTAEELENRLVWSQASTAIEPGRLAAELGALHETEFLAPAAEPGGLYFAGYMFLADDTLEQPVREVLDWCQVGGERRRGWGRLRRRSFQRHEGTVFDEFEARGEDELRLVAKGPYRLPAHLACTGQQSDLAGEWEVMSGREWAADGPGRQVARAKLCWAPGTRGGADAPREFSVDEKGVWTMVETQPAGAHGDAGETAGFREA